MSCAEGDTGFVYDGILDFDVMTSRVDHMPALKMKIMMNVGNPERAFSFAKLPNAGIGLGPSGIHHQPYDWCASKSIAEL